MQRILKNKNSDFKQISAILKCHERFLPSHKTKMNLYKTKSPRPSRGYSVKKEIPGQAGDDIL